MITVRIYYKTALGKEEVVVRQVSRDAKLWELLWLGTTRIEIISST